MHPNIILDVNKNYNRVFAEWQKNPTDWTNMKMKDRFDYRERVRRETLRGKLTIFHENIESYLTRQSRAYTTQRVFLHWLVVYLLTKKCKFNR